MSDVDLADLRATRQWVSWGVWLCAIITMVSSALSGMSTFAALKDHPYLGLVTGLSVDTALCVALIGDRVLYQHGLTVPHGRVLRWVAAIMSITLNCGAALADHRWFLAIIHTFLVLVLVLVTEYGQAVTLTYTGLIRAMETRIAEQQAAEARRAAEERSETQRRERAAQEAAQHKARVEALSALSAPRPPTRVGPAPRQQVKPLALVPAPTPRKASPVRDAAVTWLAAQAITGRDLSTVTPAEIAGEINAKYDTCKKGLPSWVARVRELSEVAV